jgi:hypothetical protein
MDAFPSAALAQHFFLAAPEPEVLAWCSQYRDRAESDRRRLPDEAMRALEERPEYRIRLEAARISPNDEVLLALWRTGDRCLRHAVATSVVTGPDSIFESRPDPLWPDPAADSSVDQVESELVQCGDRELLNLFYGNPRLSVSTVIRLLERDGVYGTMPFDDWTLIAIAVMGHPAVRGGPNDTMHSPGLEGWRAKSAASHALSLMPITSSCAYELIPRLGAIDRLVLGYRSGAGTNSQRAQLEKILARWRGARRADSPKSCLEPCLPDEAAHVRALVVEKAHPFGVKADAEYLCNHPDIAVRFAYYKLDSFTSLEDFWRYFERDKVLFLSAKTNDDSVFRRPGKVAVEFLRAVLPGSELGKSLISQGVDDSDWTSLWRRFEARCDALNRADPATYVSYSELYDLATKPPGAVAPDPPTPAAVLVKHWRSIRHGLVVVSAELAVPAAQNQGMVLMAHALAEIETRVSCVNEQLRSLRVDMNELRERVEPATRAYRGRAMLLHAGTAALGGLVGWIAGQ